MELLSIPFCIFIPMFSSFFILSPLFTNNRIFIRRFSKVFCLFHFLYSFLLLIFFNSQTPYSSEIKFFGAEWIKTLGITFFFQTDTINILLITLTSFIFLIAIFSSKHYIRQNHKLFYSMFLLLLSATLGIFSSGNIFLFFLFWELELIPIYFLIGSKYTNVDNTKAKKSAIKFVLYTFFGSLFLLIGILVLHYYNYVTTGFLTSNFNSILTVYIPKNIQLFISFCFLICFGVKLPIFPLHLWLPDAHTNAPTPVSIVLSAILLKTGAYGIYKFNYQLNNELFSDIAPFLAIFALINILYSALIAYAQQDIKRIIAYSSISNMGLILLGLCAGNSIGLSASVFHMIAHAFVTTGLFLICGIIYLRCKTRDINAMSGIANSMPIFFGFSVLIILASIGIPSFAPFISEILTIIGAMFSDLGTPLKFTSILSLPLLIISSCYMLKFLHKCFYGPQTDICKHPFDITINEFILLSSITLCLILFGLFPSAILNFLGI